MSKSINEIWDIDAAMKVHQRPHDFKTQVPIFIKQDDKTLMLVVSDEKSVDKDASDLADAYPEFEIQAGYSDADIKSFEGLAKNKKSEDEAIAPDVDDEPIDKKNLPKDFKSLDDETALKIRSALAGCRLDLEEMKSRLAELKLDACIEEKIVALLNDMNL